MSWHVTGTVSTSDTSVLRQMREEAVAQNQECGHQFDMAAKAALEIVYSTAVGPPGAVRSL